MINHVREKTVLPFCFVENHITKSSHEVVIKKYVAKNGLSLNAVSVLDWILEKRKDVCGKTGESGE